MRLVSCKTALIAALTLVFMPTHASLGAGRVQVVAFGDSLLDAGTYSPFAAKKYPGGFSFDGGRFTTNPGLNFTQDVALHYGDRLRPAFLGGFGVAPIPTGGLDYAQGGSRVKYQPGIDHAPPGTPNADFAGATTVPVQEQVTNYLSAHGRFTSGQLVLINGGADDVFFQLGAVKVVGLAAAVAEIIKSASDLANVVDTVVENGATHVAVMNLPDIGKTPLAIIGMTPLGAANQSAALTEISKLFNSTLAITLKLKKQKFGGKVILVDAFSFIDNIIANFQIYGFAVSNTGLACNLAAQVTTAYQLGLINPPIFGESLFGGSLFCSPKTYNYTRKTDRPDYDFIFADYVHPTTHLNVLFAQFVEQKIAATRWEFYNTPDENPYSSVKSQNP